MDKKNVRLTFYVVCGLLLGAPYIIKLIKLVFDQSKYACVRNGVDRPQLSLGKLEEGSEAASLRKTSVRLDPEVFQIRHTDAARASSRAIYSRKAVKARRFVGTG